MYSPQCTSYVYTEGIRIIYSWRGSKDRDMRNSRHSVMIKRKFEYILKGTQIRSTKKKLIRHQKKRTYIYIYCL